MQILLGATLNANRQIGALVGGSYGCCHSLYQKAGIIVQAIHS
ncbi:hypothetical protein ACUIJ5_00010 [Bacillus toyonensis]